jgi:type IV pilus assembly protein PilA
MIRHNLNGRARRGFTLVELLVVIVVLGILASIAVPVFLNQRVAAWKATVVSDVHNAAGQAELASQDTGGSVSDIHTAADTTTEDTVKYTITNMDDSGALARSMMIGSQKITISPGNKITLTAFTNNKYRIVGEQPSNLKGWQYVYESDKGTGKWISPGAGGPTIAAGLYVTGLYTYGTLYTYNIYRKITNADELAAARALMTGSASRVTGSYADALAAASAEPAQPADYEFIYAGSSAVDADTVYTSIPTESIMSGTTQNDNRGKCLSLMNIAGYADNFSYEEYEEGGSLSALGLSYADRTTPPTTMPADSGSLTAAVKTMTCQPLSPVTDIKSWSASDNGRTVKITSDSHGAIVQLTNTTDSEIVIKNSSPKPWAGDTVTIPAHGKATIGMKNADGVPADGAPGDGEWTATGSTAFHLTMNTMFY